VRRYASTLLLTLATSLGAQVHETVTVEVIEVPVYVTAADGKPMHGLKREAFELRVNGKPQPVEYFDEVDLASVPAAHLSGAGTSPPLVPGPETPRRPARERRLYLLVFDLVFGAKDRIIRAQHSAEAMIDQPESANDLFAVAILSPTRGLQLATSFIRDRAVLRRAIYSLRPAEESDPLGVAMSATLHNQWQQTASADLVASLGLDGEAADMVLGGVANQDAALEPRRRLVTNQFADLEAIAKRIAALEGQKHVVIFSSGWNWRLMIIPGQGYNEYPDMHAGLAKVAQAFRAAGAFLHGVDISGVRPERNAIADSQEGMRRMTRPTGGDVLASTNDFTTALTNLSTSESSVYILGFQRHGNDGGDIDVKVNGLPRGTRVAFRPGFGAPATPAAKKEVDSLLLADILLNDVPQSGVSLQSGVTPNEGGAEIAVSFARAEVVPQLLEASPAIDLMFYVFDEHGATAGFKAKRILFDATSRVSSGYVTIREPFSLPPGKYVAKALLRVAGTNSLGFTRKEFKVD
jgi:VWFA-related protein